MRLPVVTLQCDQPDCLARRQGKPGFTSGDLRQLLVQVGWYTDDAADVDYCPDHAEDEAPL